MRVDRLTLRNFRNIEESTLVPDPHLNFLIGQNGQGKTSFLEALGYLATLRSFRGAKTDEVVRWGSQSAEIFCEVTPGDENPFAAEFKTQLKLAFTLGERKTSKIAFINGKPFQSSTQYLSQRFGNFELGFHTVVFNPADHDLIRGEPANRRSYLDRVLAAEDVDYLKAVQRYKRVLEQRNALLKSDDVPSRELLSGFNDPLVKSGSYITHKRLLWLWNLAARLQNAARKIAPRQPELRAVYLSNWVPEISNLSISNNDLGAIHFAGLPQQASLELLEQAFWKRLSALEAVELRSRSSLVGPHRDDWTFFLGNQILKGHGSQGEVRSALLALKLSEIELFRERTGHRPLLLLDDFSSELDRERRAFLLRYLNETDLQVFVTSTEDSIAIGKRFGVTKGKLMDTASMPTNESGALPSPPSPEF